jgi:hypothetical protein
MRVFHDADRQGSGTYPSVGPAGFSPAFSAEIGSCVEPDRREAARVRTVYRIAPVAVGNDRGLARVRNISDGGMRLNLGLTVFLGDRVRVGLSDSLVIEGTVVWTNGDECGLKFDRTIDSIGALRESCAERRLPDARAPRLPTAITALASSERGSRSVKVCDVSQRGMKIKHDGSFTPGISVKLTLPSGIERRGVVRWSKNGVAGILLTETFSQRDLGNVGAL